MSAAATVVRSKETQENNIMKKPLFASSHCIACFLSAFLLTLLRCITEDWVARLVNHVSELVIEVKRVDRSHETAVAGAGNCNRFFAYSSRQVASGG